MLSSRRAVQWMANETSLHASRARGEPLPPQTGRARALSRASNTRNEGSTPSAPAKMIQVGTFRGMPVFVDDATGNVVDENWWPDTTVNGHPPTTT